MKFTGENHSSGRASRRAVMLATGAILAAGALALSGCTPTSSGASSDATTITVWHYFSDANQVKVMTDYKGRSSRPTTTVSPSTTCTCRTTN
ncbi:hypothetical protein [Arthrobacter psychrolactophilus]